MSIITTQETAAVASAAVVAGAAAAVARANAGAPGRAAHAIHECLSFRVAEEEYGIDILRVQEIRSFETPTRIAGVPDFIRGVLNLRGVIVPIVDLRMKLGCEARFDTSTVTVVINVHGRTMGVVVDSVSDVQRLTPEQLKPAPEFSGTLRTGHVIGLACIQHMDRERLLILLDIERLMTDSDMGLVAQTAEEGAL